MIPKVIHYCWFGRKPLPELAKNVLHLGKNSYQTMRLRNGMKITLM